MFFKGILFLIAFNLSNLCWSLEPQNVILITIDGVRYKDVFKPEAQESLKSKKGFPLFHTLKWVKEQHGYIYGTQRFGDEMEVGNTSSLSLPGYKVIFSGRKESICIDNYTCDFPKHETLIDRLMNEFKDPSQVALFSSWNYIRYATEGSYGHRAMQSIGLTGLKNFKNKSEVDQNFYEFFKNIQKTSSTPPHTPEWANARMDRYTWALARSYLLSYYPRFLYISLLDTDEYGHAGSRTKYFDALSWIDDQLLALISDLQKNPNYFKNTSIVITTDHGRGGEAWNFDYHGTHYGVFMKGSENVWAMVIPSQSIREAERIRRAEATFYSQLDIRPTVEELFRLKPSSNIEGNSLVSFKKPETLLNRILHKLGDLFNKNQ